MIQIPIHVTPSNGEVMNADDGHLRDSFVFQGDLLTFVQTEYADMEYLGNPSSGTNEFVAWSNFPQNGHLSAIHNGTVVGSIDNGWAANFLHDGRNYKYRKRLFQHYPDTMPEKYARKPLADMYYARGKIYAQPTGTATYYTYIAPNLTNIHEPYEYNWTDDDDNNHKLLLGAIFMEIEHQRYMIRSYDSSTGRVMFTTPNYIGAELSDGYTALEISGYTTTSVPEKFHTEGTPYKLFTNYIETGWYDFKYRTKPTITTRIHPTAVYSADNTTKQMEAVRCGIYCDGTYTQAVAVGLKWYQYKLFAVDADSYNSGNTYKSGDLTEHNNKLYRCNGTTTGTFDNTKWTEVDPDDYGSLVDKSERIFSYDLDTAFPTHAFEFGYSIKLTIATQDDDVQTTTYTVGRYIQFPECEFTHFKINGKEIVLNDPSSSITIHDSKIELSWIAQNSYVFSIFRREVYRDGTVSPVATYLGNLHPKWDGLTRWFYFTDYSVGNNQTYQYEIIVKSGNNDSIATYCRPLEMKVVYNVRTDWEGWTITALKPTKDAQNRKHMTVGDEWTFISKIDSGTITHNINSVLQVGTATYTQTSRDYNQYESGTFTADLLTVECPDNTIVDDIQRAKEWTKFISQNCPFMLKSAKGDVWIVNIVNSPTRQYDESINPIFTNVGYEWAECENTEKCVFSK